MGSDISRDPWTLFRDHHRKRCCRASHCSFYSSPLCRDHPYGGPYLIVLPIGRPFLLIFGIFSGIFLGGWILALAEIADMFPVFVRRIQLKQGLPLIILSIAAGKAAGALIYYYFGW